MFHCLVPLSDKLINSLSYGSNSHSPLFAKKEKKSRSSQSTNSFWWRLFPFSRFLLCGARRILEELRSRRKISKVLDFSLLVLLL